MTETMTVYQAEAPDFEPKPKEAPRWLGEVIGVEGAIIYLQAPEWEWLQVGGVYDIGHERDLHVVALDRERTCITLDRARNGLKRADRVTWTGWLDK